MDSDNAESLNGSKEVDSAVSTADPYRGQGTVYLHLAERENEIGKENPTGAVVFPISLATTFRQSTPGLPTAPEDPNSFGKGYEYSRTGNPTRGAFERAVAAAEHANHCVAFASGSAATSAVIHLLNHGDHVLCVDDVYGGTQRYFRKIVAPQMGIKVDFVDLTGPSITLQDDTRLVWLETPTNPTLKVTDIADVAAETKKRKDCLLAVDNTFCSPYFQTPLDHGADLVVHSVTKYIGGHSDVVMGVVCTNREDLYDKLRFLQNGIGAVPSPFDCFLAHRGLKTLHVRMEAAARYGMRTDICCSLDCGAHHLLSCDQKCPCDCSLLGQTQGCQTSGISWSDIPSSTCHCQKAAARIWSHDYLLLHWWQGTICSNSQECKATDHTDS